MSGASPGRRAVLLAGLLCALPAAGDAAAQAADGSAVGMAVDRVYGAVDAHADATPPEAERSVAELAAYLSRAGDGDAERIRAVYRWITRNVAYDARGYRTGEYGDLTPEGVLRRRVAVCTGYAALAEALGRAMGMEIRVVDGWSKGYGYTAGQGFGGPTNHAWNAVKVDGRWQLMDPTWGAGYLSGSFQFVPRFREHYFLTDPQAFVFDHLPQDPEWQLLDDPLEPDEYAELVSLRPPFFSTGLEVRSHERVRIAAGARLTVRLGAPDDVQLAAVLVDPESGDELDESHTFVQVAHGEARIDAVFPGAGDYVLRLFAKPKGAEGPYEWALDYRVEADAGEPDGGFPFMFGTFRARGAVLYEPMRGALEAGRSHHFRIRVPGALKVAVVSGGTWTHLTPGGDGIFEGEAVAAPGDTRVHALFEEGATYPGLLKYTGR